MTRAIRAFYLSLFVFGSLSFFGVGEMIQTGIAREYGYASSVLFAAGTLSFIGGFFGVALERALK